MEPRYVSITWLAPGIEINKHIFVVVYRSIFTGVTISISYFSVFYIFFQFFQYFQAFSNFCIFRVYFSSILWSVLFFLGSQFFTNIFVYFQVFYVFHIFRVYYIFYILKFSMLSLRLCFSYVLYFEFCQYGAPFIPKKSTHQWFFEIQQTLFLIFMIIKMSFFPKNLTLSIFYI